MKDRDSAALQSEAQQINDWLLQEAPHLSDIGEIVAALAERLNAAGIPVVRATSHVATLHPLYRAAMRVWRHGETVREIRPLHAAGNSPLYWDSPLRQVRESGAWLDIRLDQRADPELPIYDELRAEGLRHYLMAPVPFSDGSLNAVSWATDEAAGFSAQDRALLLRILPALAVVIELRALHRVGPELLSAYVGRDPAERILAGSVQRGDLQNIEAAILLADLRGFTAITDREQPDRVIAWLNGYFDAVVPEIETAGGEVLKFMGDGILAVFPIDPAVGLTDQDACDRALQASQSALEKLSSASEALAPYQAGIALHFGAVAYGNIGAGARLDFTAIGRDVNLVSRLGSLCRTLERPLLLSDVFAELCSAPALELGVHNLTGFRAPLAVFAPDGATPGSRVRSESATTAGR